MSNLNYKGIFSEETLMKEKEVILDVGPKLIE